MDSLIKVEKNHKVWRCLSEALGSVRQWERGESGGALSIFGAFLARSPPTANQRSDRLPKTEGTLLVPVVQRRSFALDLVSFVPMLFPCRSLTDAYALHLMSICSSSPKLCAHACSLRPHICLACILILHRRTRPEAPAAPSTPF